MTSRRRKTLFISHDLLQMIAASSVTFNAQVVTPEIERLVMSRVAERAEWTNEQGDVVTCTEGIPHDASITAMIRLFDRHGWLFLIEADSFGEVPEGHISPEIQPVFNVRWASSGNSGWHGIYGVNGP